MRLRLPELLKARGMSRYAFAKAVQAHISESTAYRLAAGQWKCLPAETMDVLCDVLGVEPGELFEREKKRGKRG